MLTNPNTLGLFEEDIVEIAAAVHEVGGLMYYDGANLNAILGMVRPGDMGFDIVHLNLHKTFATPHGGGGPGAGPVVVGGPSGRVPARPPAGAPGGPGDADRAAPLRVATPARSIGRVHGWHGNALVLARALAYIEIHGRDGLRPGGRAGRAQRQLDQTAALGRPSTSPSTGRACTRWCSRPSALRKRTGATALDVAKGLIEEGFHPPTVAFPLIVDDALDGRADRDREPTDPGGPGRGPGADRGAGPPAGAGRSPRTTPVRRVDEARAARTLVPTFDARR